MKNKIQILSAIIILVLISIACGGNAVPAMSTPTPYMSTSTPLATVTSMPASMITFAPLPFTVQAPVTAEAGNGIDRQGGAGQGTGQWAQGIGTLPPPTADANINNSRRIYFLQGGTATSVIGGVNPDETLTYSMYVLGNQPAEITLETEDKNLSMAIYDPNIYELLAPVSATSWKGYFQKAGYYYVNVQNHGTITSKFTLSISIAARVVVDAGTEVTLKGSTAAGYPMSYVIHGNKDQILDVKLNTEPKDTTLAIWGFIDNQTYADKKENMIVFSMPIPATQDYIISVVPKNKKDLHYILNVSLK